MTPALFGMAEAGLPALRPCPMVLALPEGEVCGVPATRLVRLLCDDGHSSAVDVCPDHEATVRDDPESVACLTCSVQGRDSAVRLAPP